MGVLLALDVGEKRIGVATSDPLGILASPLTTLRRESTTQAIEDVAALVRRHHASD